ncbi:MAG: hypothetical protein P8X42_06280 [Calditrichaceae bacterium]|jgi:hypothetical protein
MSENIIDLKNLLLLIDQGKDMNANLCLDEGCHITGEDSKTLVKVINYFINLLQPLTTLPLEIGLDLKEDGSLLTIMAYTETEEPPKVSDNVAGALQEYNGGFEIVHQPGVNIQCKITFKNK